MTKSRHDHVAGSCYHGLHNLIGNNHLWIGSTEDTVGLGGLYGVVGSAAAANTGGGGGGGGATGGAYGGGAGGTGICYVYWME